MVVAERYHLWQKVTGQKRMSIKDYLSALKDWNELVCFCAEIVQTYKM